MKERFGGFLKKTSAKRLWPYFFILAAGVVLMFLGAYADGGSKERGAPDAERTELLSVVSETNAADDFSGYAAALEKKLSETLSNVQGAGKVQVLLTLESHGEVTLAEDTTYEAARAADSGGDGSNNLTEKKETKHVLATEKDGRTAPVIVKRAEPKIGGVIIVAEGGGSAEIKALLTKAAGALLNLPAHKIEVLKMNKQ